MPVGYDTDALYLLAVKEDAEGNIITKNVKSYAMARDIIEEVLGSEDQYRYIDEYDWRVTGYFDDPETGYARPEGQRVWYWTLEKVIDYKGNVAFKVIQPWGVKVEDAAYRVTVGDVAFYYNRAGQFMFEEIAVEDDDPFDTGISGTAIYTYSKMVAKSNEAYYLSCVACVHDDVKYAMAYEDFLPNAAKSGLYLHIIEN